MHNRNSKNGYYWSDSAPALSIIRSHNILRGRPGLVGSGYISTHRDAFELFINSTIVEEVIQCSNLEGRRIAATQQKELNKIDKDKIMAVTGLTLLASVEKNWDVPVRELFGDALQDPMCRATMTINRFEDILRMLRFDDKRNRAERLREDHLAAFRHIWELFLVNCREKFALNDCVTIDEQLLPFRRRCRFIQYMPTMPAKYGIKIFWMCDSRVPYANDGIIYMYWEG